jgi:hypothetical protein
MRAQLNAFVNHGIRPDPDCRIQFCLRMNDGGWVNHFAATDSHRFAQIQTDFIQDSEA